MYQLGGPARVDGRPERDAPQKPGFQCGEIEVLPALPPGKEQLDGPRRRGPRHRQHGAQRQGGDHRHELRGSFRRAQRRPRGLHSRDRQNRAGRVLHGGGGREQDPGIRGNEALPPRQTGLHLVRRRRKGSVDRRKRRTSFCGAQGGRGFRRPGQRGISPK